MAEMEQKFPADLEYAITLDTTEAVLVGIEEIVITLVIAFVLVILSSVFLQDWRATLIRLAVRYRS
jgi:HAE1 family hydrophobic/amphiphilic exporter-1